MKDKVLNVKDLWGIEGSFLSEGEDGRPRRFCRIETVLRSLLRYVSYLNTSSYMLDNFVELVAVVMVRPILLEFVAKISLGDAE